MPDAHLMPSETLPPSETWPYVADNDQVSSKHRLRATIESVVSMGPHQGSRLETVRRQCKLIVPPLLLGRVQKVEGAPTTCVADQEVIKARFPSLFGQPIVSLVSDASPASGDASADRLFVSAACCRAARLPAATTASVASSTT